MIPKTFKRLIVQEHNTDIRKALKVVEVEFPPLAPDEILMRTMFAGVNAGDVVRASTGYGDEKPPYLIGVESVGEVVWVGDKVKDFGIGDPVIGFNPIGGGYSEYRVLKPSEVIAAPEGSPELMCIANSGVTASIGLEVVGEMKSNENVLVTAAAGGTGSFAVQLARLAGNHVIGTCGSAEKAEQLKRLGCHRVVNYRNEDVDAVLTKEYPQGINLVYETVGREMFDIALAHLALLGRLICVGAVSEYKRGYENWEKVERTRIYTSLLGNGASVRGYFMPFYDKYRAEHMAKLVKLYQAGQLKALIDPKEFIGLESVPSAIEYLHSGQSVGKVMVRL